MLKTRSLEADERPYRRRMQSGPRPFLLDSVSLMVHPAPANECAVGPQIPLFQSVSASPVRRRHRVGLTPCWTVPMVMTIGASPFV